MTDEKNRFFEHQRIKNAVLEKAIREDKNLQKYFKADFDGIKARHYCGIVSVEGEDFYILPKVAQKWEENFDIFMKMLMVAMDMSVEWVDVSGSAHARHRLFQALIDLFTKELLLQLRSGLHREYVTQQEWLRTLRGKYLIDRNFFSLDRSRIACEYDEFSMDNEINRFLLFVIKTLIPFAYNTKHLRLAEAVLDETRYLHHNIRRLPEFHFTKLNNRYRKSVEMGVWLLRHLTPLFSLGKRSFAFLFDMNELFEKYVGVLVKQIRSDAKLQAERHFGNLVLKPDILIENELIIDTKYKKVISRDDISAADKYQMFVYGKNFGINKVILLYPEFNNSFDDQLILGTTNPVILSIKCINLRNIVLIEEIIYGL